MKTSSILFVCIVLIPSIVLGWYSVRMEQQQQRLLKHQQDAYVQQQITQVDDLFQQYFFRLEQALLQDVSALNPTLDPFQLRKFSAASPFIEQIFQIDSERAVRFPQKSNASQQEIRFLEQAQRLLSSEMFWQQQSELAQPDIVSARLAPQPQSKSLNFRSALSDYSQIESQAEATDTVMPRDKGWIAWHNNADLQLVFWLKNSRGEILGFLLNRSRVISDLINLLPETFPADQISHYFELMDNNQQLLHQWGEVAANQTYEEKQQHLSHPLSSWQISHFNNTTGFTGANLWADKLITLLLTFAALSIIALKLYRDHKRSRDIAAMRVNFVNQVSHELKTPLTNIRLYAEMLEQRLQQDQRGERYANVIVNEGDRLGRLIDNMLNFSRLDQKREIKLNYQQGAIEQCIQSCLDSFEPAMAQRNFAVRFDYATTVSCYYDSHLLMQILNNLLSNCEKYLPEGSEIELRLSLQRENCTIEIMDNGPGIPENLHQRVFEPFYRVSNELTDGVSGTGIGLSLSRQLALLHGGDLKLIPAECGAHFMLTLRTPQELSQ